MAKEMLGAITKIAYGKESGLGGAATVNKSLGILNSGISLPDKTADVKQFRSFGAGRRWHKSVVGRYEFQGSIPFLPTNGETFYYAFGADSVIDASGAGTPHYVHRMYPANKAALPSMSVTAEIGGGLDDTFGTLTDSGNARFRRTYKGVTVNSMSWSLAEAGELACSMDVVAQDITADDTDPGTDLNVDPEAGSPYMFYDRAAKIQLAGSYTAPAQGALQTETAPTWADGTHGREVARVRNFNFSIANNLKPMYVFNQGGAASRKPYAFVPSYPNFSLNLEITPSHFLGSQKATEDVVYDLIRNDVRGDIRIPFQKDANTDRMEFVFYGCRFQSAPHALPDDGAEITVPVAAIPENFAVFVWDNKAAY